MCTPPRSPDGSSRRLQPSVKTSTCAYHQQTGLVHVACSHHQGQDLALNQLLALEQINTPTHQPPPSFRRGADHNNRASGSSQHDGLFLQLHRSLLLQRADVCEADGVIPADGHAQAVCLHGTVAIALMALGSEDLSKCIQQSRALCPEPTPARGRHLRR